VVVLLIALRFRRGRPMADRHVDDNQRKQQKLIHKDYFYPLLQMLFLVIHSVCYATRVPIVSRLKDRKHKPAIQELSLETTAKEEKKIGFI
jgi:hypothetical protein